MKVPTRRKPTAIRITPGDQRRQHQAVIAFALDDQRHQHDEGAGRPADLEAAAAEQRDQEAADDGGIETALGADAGCDRDRHRQRQRDDRDGQAGDRVGAQVLEAVALAQDGDELRREELGKRRLRCWHVGDGVEAFMRRGGIEDGTPTIAWRRDRVRCRAAVDRVRSAHQLEADDAADDQGDQPSRSALAGSENRMMPRIATPTAPIPVQTA